MLDGRTTGLFDGWIIGLMDSVTCERLPFAFAQLAKNPLIHSSRPPALLRFNAPTFLTL